LNPSAADYDVDSSNADGKIGTFLSDREDDTPAEARVDMLDKCARVAECGAHRC